MGKAHLSQQAQRILVDRELSLKILSEVPVYRSVRSLAIEDEKKTLQVFPAEDLKKLVIRKANFTIGRISGKKISTFQKGTMKSNQFPKAPIAVAQNGNEQPGYKIVWTTA